MTGSHSILTQKEMNNFVLLEINKESSKMEKEKCGYNSLKKHGAKFVVVMKQVKWVQLWRPSTILMELPAKFSSQT